MALPLTSTDTRWLRLADYKVVPMKSQWSLRAEELRQGLRKGLLAIPDPEREGFYVVRLPGGWIYIHVNENLHTIYLVGR